MSNDQVNPAGPPTVSVVTAAFAVERWDELRKALASVLVQTVPVLEVIVVIDHNPVLLDRARCELHGVVVIPNTRSRGASGARNSGVAVSRGEIAAFLDDDAVASPTWLEALLAHFSDPRVVGVGSRIVPVWTGSRPRWLPREFDWTVGASYRGMPEEAGPVRNVWSCGMAVSRQVFDAIGGFRDDFGKVGSRSRPEDTDLCLRVAAAQPDGIWMYEPAGVVAHLVPLGRATPRFFLRRCLLEGSGKAVLAALDGTGRGTSQERLYTRRVLPRGVARGLRDAVRGDVSGGLRSLAIAAGFGFAVAGFVAVRTAGIVRRAHRPQAPGREAPAPDASGGFCPALMMDIELTRPLPAIGHDGQHRRAWVLGRLHGEPVGSCLIRLDPAGLTPDQLGALLWPELGEPVTERFAAAGRPEPAMLTGQGLTADAAAWPFLLRRRQVLAAAPAVSVVICTRDRPDQLAACLGHLARQEYPRFEVVVVDNAPAGDAVRRVVEARRPACRYVPEPRGGLSWARNAGIAAASGDIIAFLDDDETPDAHWLAGLAGGFARGGDVGCVTGVILPARLDTQAQEWFERVGGHSKGRGFRPAVFSRYGPQSPLYPLPPFGAGGNMAFRRAALVRIGGFDVAMGAGTPARASEDTLAFTLVLLAGYRIAYEPAALVRHDHYAGMDGLGRQLSGYGVGLTAYYTALLRHRPGVFPALLRLLPAAAGYLRGADGTDPDVPQSLPPQFKRAQRWGMLTGPVAYLQSVRRQARIAAAESQRAAAQARRTAPEARP